MQLDRVARTINRLTPPSEGTQWDRFAQLTPMARYHRLPTPTPTPIKVSSNYNPLLHNYNNGVCSLWGLALCSSSMDRSHLKGFGHFRIAKICRFATQYCLFWCIAGSSFMFVSVTIFVQFIFLHLSSSECSWPLINEFWNKIKNLKSNRSLQTCELFSIYIAQIL